MGNASAVEALPLAALEKGTVAERAAYLDSACGGDAELRRQVDKLLNAHPRVGDFLSKPGVEQLAAAPEPSEATREFGTSTDGPSAACCRSKVARRHPSSMRRSFARIGHIDQQLRPRRLLTTKRRFVPWALASALAMTQRGWGQLRA
jgi:hypothetical protein